MQSMPHVPRYCLYAVYADGRAAVSRGQAGADDDWGLAVQQRPAAVSEKEGKLMEHFERWRDLDAL